MKLTCVATPGSGGGGGYHSPASHLLELEGIRLLLDCPVDLSALAAFTPVPLGADCGDAGDLIRAVPYYWSPAASAAAKAGGVDAVLVSSATGMLGLPFLTRLPSFANTKVYVTELAAKIGKLMMGELLEMHSEFLSYYGPDTDGPPKWMQGEKLHQLLSSLQNIVIEDEGIDLAPLMPLYSAPNIEECMRKTQTVKYGEEVCFNGMTLLKASSSGLELGSCVWSIKGPRASITYLPSTVFVSAHALDCDYNSLKENDIILFSDFSSLNVMDANNENLGENAMLCDDSVLRDGGVDEDEDVQCLSKNDDIAEEIERISFICSCISDAVKSGGSVLIPIGRLGVILLILEHISETLHSFNMKVPIFMISGAAEKIISFTNAVPEWLCKPRQEKLFSRDEEALFGHVELLKEGRLFLFPHLYSKGLLAVWKEPCIVFCPDWSLRHGTAVHLLRRWHADKRNLLVLEQGVDAELALKPFTPVSIQVLECSFLSGIKVRKVNPLLSVLKPKLVLFPEDLKSRCPLKEDAPWSYLYYSKGKTIKVPNIREDFEVRLAADVAFGLQPRQLDKAVAVARLRAKLHLSNGQYVLVAAPNDQPDQSNRQLLHWGAVDAGRVLSALQEKGMECAFHADDDDDSSAGCERSILITGPGEALVKITSERTVIYCDDEGAARRIYDALSSVCNGI
ncbi:integrator complex subunit 9 [Hordeum vulgare]|nr:integrator complex subunit 9 [Hordeum vulgare]